MISAKLLRWVDVFIGIRRLLWLDVAAAETHLLRVSCYWRIMRCPDSGGALWWRRRRWAVARICSKNRVQSRHPKSTQPKRQQKKERPFDRSSKSTEFYFCRKRVRFVLVYFHAPLFQLGFPFIFDQ